MLLHFFHLRDAYIRSIKLNLLKIEEFRVLKLTNINLHLTSIRQLLYMYRSHLSLSSHILQVIVIIIRTTMNTSTSPSPLLIVHDIRNLITILLWLHLPNMLLILPSVSTMSNIRLVIHMYGSSSVGSQRTVRSNCSEL